MGALFAILTVVVLMIIGVPVVFSFAAMTLVLSYAYEVDISSLMTTGFWSLNSVIIIALPLFVMTGYLMQAGGMASRLVMFVEALVGRSRVGMGSSMVVSCGIFGAISGTASAAVASIGTIMINPMEKHGYSRPYSTALLSISSLLGLLIPPSITMILYAVVTRQSVAACFLATVGPGILLIVVLCVLNALKMRKDHAGSETVKLTFIEHMKLIKTAGLEALPALVLPVIILGGIYGGFFTPTEAAAIAVVYALPVGLFIYKDLTLKKIGECLVAAATTTGVIMVILLFSFIASRIFTFERIPQDLTELLMGTFQNPMTILILINVFLILLGMIMDDVSVVAIVSPLLLPVMESIGVSAIQFAAIVGTSVVIGCNSPPMAPILFMACRIGNVGMKDVVRPALFFIFAAALPVMLLTTFWAPLSLFIPKLFGFIS